MDLLKEPNRIAQSEQLAAASAIWYYKKTGMDELARQDLFGDTTRKLNEYECSGKAGHHMQAARVKTYHRVRQCFNLPATAEKLTC